jgi:hypothetical protein
MNLAEEIFKQYGFLRAGSCNCGGTRNEIYKRDAYLIYYRKRMYTFRIKRKNEVIAPVQSLSNLQTVLNQLFPDVVLEKKV